MFSLPNSIRTSAIACLAFFLSWTVFGQSKDTPKKDTSLKAVCQELLLSDKGPDNSNLKKRCIEILNKETAVKDKSVPRDGYYIFGSLKLDKRATFKPIENAYKKVPVTREADDFGMNRLSEDRSKFDGFNEGFLLKGMGIGFLKGNWDGLFTLYLPQVDTYRFSSESRIIDMREWVDYSSVLNRGYVTTSFGLDYKVQITHTVTTDMTVSFKLYDEIRIGISPLFDFYKISTRAERNDCLRSEINNSDNADIIKNEGQSYEECVADKSEQNNYSASLSVAVPVSYRIYFGDYFMEPSASYRLYDSYNSENKLDFNIRFGSKL